jgi:hypothetical protein
MIDGSDGNRDLMLAASMLGPGHGQPSSGGGMMETTEQAEPQHNPSDAEQAQIIVVGTVSGQTRDRKRDLVERTVDVAHIRRSFEGFLASLKNIIDVQVPSVGAFELEEVQFNAEIAANGDFKLLGTGVGIEAQSGVSFTMRRRSP